jgi:hypothetical protein
MLNAPSPPLPSGQPAPEADTSIQPLEKPKPPPGQRIIKGAKLFWVNEKGMGTRTPGPSKSGPPDFQ